MEIWQPPLFDMSEVFPFMSRVRVDHYTRPCGGGENEPWTLDGSRGYKGTVVGGPADSYIPAGPYISVLPDEPQPKSAPTHHRSGAPRLVLLYPTVLIDDARGEQIEHWSVVVNLTPRQPDLVYGGDQGGG